MKVKYKISDIFDLQMGKTPSRDEQSFWNSNDYKWVAIGDFDECKYIENTSEYISSQAVKNTGIKIVPKNTVIMSFKLSIGKVAITKEDMYTNEAIMAFFNKGVVNIELSYLYYLLKSYKWDLLAQRAAKGKSLNKEILNNATLCFHSNIQTQKEIVAVLDKVTSLISMRKEQLEKLDILVKSKFIEMFGDPVLNPKGWEKKKLGEVCNVVVGGDVPLDNFSKEKNEDYNIPIYSNGLAENMLYGYTNNARIQQPCVTVSARGTIGYCFPHFKPFYPIVRLLCVIPSNNFSILFLCNQINSINIKSSGSGVAQLTSPMIKSCALIIPPLDLQNQFAEFVEQVENNKEKIKSSLNQLETLYSALMQEYFG